MHAKPHHPFTVDMDIATSYPFISLSGRWSTVLGRNNGLMPYNITHIKQKWVILPIETECQDLGREICSEASRTSGVICCRSTSFRLLTVDKKNRVSIITYPLYGVLRTIDMLQPRDCVIDLSARTLWPGIRLLLTWLNEAWFAYHFTFLDLTGRHNYDHVLDCMIQSRG